MHGLDLQGEELMKFKFYLISVVSSIFVLIGCNDDSSSSTADTTPQPPASPPRVYPTFEGLYEITVLQTLNVAIAQGKTPVIVIGSFSDGTRKDITKDVKLVIKNEKLAIITDDNRIYGMQEGDTSIHAESSGITSAIIPLKVVEGICGGKVNNTQGLSASGNCVKVISRKGEHADILHTFTPSVKFMQTMGLEMVNTTQPPSGLSYSNSYRVGENELEFLPPYSPDVPFALFRLDGLTFNDDPTSPDYGQRGQVGLLCELMASVEFMGRTDWDIPTLEQTEAMYKDYPLGELYYDYGVPVSYAYWTKSPDTNNISKFMLRAYVIEEAIFSRERNISAAAGCVSVSRG